MRQPPIRYFCVVSEATAGIGALSFDYFCALKDLGFYIRVVPLYKSDVGDPASRWHRHPENFTQSLPQGDYLNVVCGHGPDLVKCYTVGVKNLAIAMNEKLGQKELAALADYESVICPSVDDTAALRKEGVSAHWLLASQKTELDILVRSL